MSEPATPKVTSLAELFQRDPENLTKDDLTQIITAFRDARTQFSSGKKAAASRVKMGTKHIMSVDELFS